MRTVSLLECGPEAQFLPQLAAKASGAEFSVRRKKRRRSSFNSLLYSHDLNSDFVPVCVSEREREAVKVRLSPVVNFDAPARALCDAMR